MSNLMKFNCALSSYMELSDPTPKNLQSNNLIIGTVENSSFKNPISSILNFKCDDIDVSNVDSVSLYIYLENIHSPDFPYKNISISENIGNKDLTTLNVSAPPLSSKNTVESCIPSKFIQHYISIDISELYKNLKFKDSNFSIIIDSPPSKATSIIKFSSVNSQNPPYIVLSLNGSYDEKEKELANTKDFNNVLKGNEFIELKKQLTSVNKTISEMTKELYSLSEKLKKVSIESIEEEEGK